MTFRCDPANFNQQWASQKPFWVSHVITYDSISAIQAYAALSAETTHHFIYHLSADMIVLGFAPDQVLLKNEVHYINHAQYLANGQLRLRQEIEDYQQADFVFPPPSINCLAVGAWFGADLSLSNPLETFLPQGFYLRPRLLLVFDKVQQTISLHVHVDQQYNPDQVNGLIQAETLIENALSRLTHGTHALPLHKVLPTPTAQTLWAEVVPADNVVRVPFDASALCFYRQLNHIYTPHSLQLFCVDNHVVVLQKNLPLAVLHDGQLILPHNEHTEQLLQVVYAAEYG